MDTTVQAVLKEIGDAIEGKLGGVRFKNVPSSTPTTTYGHGPGGLFSYPGMSRPVFSAMILPRLGLQSILPVRPSNEANPLYPIFTGVTASTGSEPTGVCDDPPVAGLSKLCTHSFVFGRQSRMTRVFELDRMGLTTNRGEFYDYQFMGKPWLTGNPNVPTMPGFGGDLSAVLRAETAKALWELAVTWARDFAATLYTGNPANNTAGGGAKYYDGLDRLINTGYRDAISGQACAAADSLIFDYANAVVETDAASIIRRFTSVWRRLKDIAARTGLAPATWAVSMRWGLFYALSEVWPCAYYTYRCNTGYFSASQPQFVDSQRLIELRDAMRGNLEDRTGQFLLIDGERIPVIIDDAIPEEVLPGASFRSPIYIVPLTVLGGMPVTYLEHLNYDAPNGAMEAARVFSPDGFFYTSDGGRFLWHKKPPNNFCVQAMAKTEPRLLLLTPYIAARLTNLVYTPIAHERDWNTASSYFVDGGRTSYPGYPAGMPSFFTPVP